MFERLSAQVLFAPLRFPPALLAAGAAACTTGIWGTAEGKPPVAWLLALGAICAWSAAIRLASEVHPRLKPVRHAAPWLPCVLLALPPWLGNAVPALALLAGSGVLAIAAAPLAAPSGQRVETSRAYPRSLVWAVLLSCAAALLVAVGLSLLVGGIEALFEIKWMTRLLPWIWSIALLLGLPWIALALLPAVGADIPPFPRWMLALLDWLLVPLASAHAVLLNVYCLSILARQELPKGVIGPMGVAFAIVGGSVWALAGMAGDGRPRLTRLFHRALLPALAAPAVAMGVAAWVRIQAHGLTEQRYLLLLLAAGLLALAAAQGIGRRIPLPGTAALLFAVLLSAAAISPWGASSLSLDSQLRHLHDTLARVGHLREGKVAPDGPPLSPPRTPMPSPRWWTSWCSAKPKAASGRGWHCPPTNGQSRAPGTSSRPWACAISPMGRRIAASAR